MRFTFPIRTVKRFGDRRGAVAVIMAICAPVLLMMIGFAIDYGYALDLQQRIDAAADTGVLAALSPTTINESGGYAAAYGAGTGAGNVMWQLAYDTFVVNTQNVPITVTPTTTISQATSGTTTTYTASISWTANVPTWFAGLIGMSSIPISGHSQASVVPPVFIRYFILVDISQSMGIGATATDMQNLFNLVSTTPNQATGGETGCVFGCHVAIASNAGPTQSQSNEALAHNNGIQLRIDSANSAIQTMIQTAIADENATTPNIQIGLYTMTDYPSATVTQVFAPTTSLSQYKTTTVDLDLSPGAGDSDFYDQITTFTNNYLPAQGTGQSSSSPINYVFLITDGLVDTPGSCTSGHCTNAFQSSYCTQLQNKANVGVIYTQYLPIYSNNSSSSGYEYNYQDLVYPYVGSIATNLQSCASSTNFYYLASDGPSISTGIQSLFLQSLGAPRLTQ